MGCLFLAGVAVQSSGQVVASEPAFEVASVKLLEQRRPGPSRVAGRRLTYPFVTLQDLIGQAYSAKNYQIRGPSWLGVSRYEVLANIPADSNPGQVPAMLRRLLQDRFGLEVHREAKSRSVYVLLADPSGPKLTRADTAGRAKEPSQGQAQQPAFWISSTGRLRFRATTMERFAEALSGSLGEPVLDRTGIEGEYDIEIGIDPSELGGLRLQVDANGTLVQEQAPGPNIRGELRRLGLRLAIQRAEIQYIFVDNVRRVPTPN